MSISLTASRLSLVSLLTSELRFLTNCNESMEIAAKIPSVYCCMQDKHLMTKVNNNWPSLWSGVSADDWTKSLDTSTLYLKVGCSLLLKLVGVMMNLEPVQTRHELKNISHWSICNYSRYSQLHSWTVKNSTWFAGLLGLYSGWTINNMWGNPVPKYAPSVWWCLTRMIMFTLFSYY